MTADILGKRAVAVEHKDSCQIVVYPNTVTRYSYNSNYRLSIELKGVNMILKSEG